MSPAEMSVDWAYGKNEGFPVKVEREELSQSYEYGNCLNRHMQLKLDKNDTSCRITPAV